MTVLFIKGNSVCSFIPKQALSLTEKHSGMDRGDELW